MTSTVFLVDASIPVSLHAGLSRAWEGRSPRKTQGRSMHSSMCSLTFQSILGTKFGRKRVYFEYMLSSLVLVLFPALSRLGASFLGARMLRNAHLAPRNIDQVHSRWPSSIALASSLRCVGAPSLGLTSLKPLRSGSDPRSPSKAGRCAGRRTPGPAPAARRR